jgi:hypothetical protein
MLLDQQKMAGGWWKCGSHRRLLMPTSRGGLGKPYKT